MSSSYPRDSWDNRLERLKRKPREPRTYEMYSSFEGRMFERWIDETSGTRTNGRNEGDLIKDVSGIVESILRDEVFAVRDLKIASVIDTTTIEVDTLNDVSDYYNNAVYFNLTTGHKTYVTDYDGNNKYLTLAADDTSAAPGDFLILSNVQGDNRIDDTTFDTVGNTTNGKRKDWVFARSINAEQPASNLLDSLLFESFCILVSSYNKYKIIALDTETGSVDTWTNPIKDSSGLELVTCEFTPGDNLYNDFEVNYAYDPGKGEYRQRLFVSDGKYSSTLANGATLQGLCEDIVANYGTNKRFIYNCDWIHTEATADLFLDKLVNWLTKDRLIVTWGGDVKNYLKYELGDQVILNYSGLIPNSLNNSAKFMIMTKQMVPNSGDPYIIFTLLQMT